MSVKAVEKIGIYLLSSPRTNEKAVETWLSGLGVKDTEEWRYAPLSMLAAKRCYNSFEVGLNPNVTRVREDWVEYIDNILRSRHGCYDEETDVLTSEGWKSWATVVEDDLLCTLNPDTQEIEYIKPVSLIKYEHTGPMYRTKSGQVDLLVTPDHKHYVQTLTTKESRTNNRNNLQLIKARDLDGKAHCYQKSAKAFDGDGGLEISEDECELLGFAIGDGYWDNGRVSFHLRRPRKIEYLQRLCNKMYYDLKEQGDNYVVYPMYSSWFEKIYNEDGEKCIPQELLMKGTAAQLKRLYLGLIESDGSYGPTSTEFITTSEELAGQYQQLCLHLGFASNLTVDTERKDSYGTKPLYNISNVHRALKPEVNKCRTTSGKMYYIPNWQGMVYCAQMPKNHILYVRRNGKPVWSGNSVLEHSSFTFAIEGLSRVATAELNRHRAGVAVSEASMRYIRFGEEMRYYLPPSLRANDGDNALLAERKYRSREVFKQVFQLVQDGYKELEKIWDIENIADFGTKKVITSMMRRIVPQGVCTGGVWSFNIRALRHVLTMRANPHAEEEICEVMCEVGKIMVEDIGFHEFGDFDLVDSKYWVPKYEKV